MSWTCTNCERTFKHNHQNHYCGNRTIADFLSGKNENMIALFDHFIAKYTEIGPVKLHATKAMIALGNEQRFAYIIQIGKSFIDVVFPFDEAFEDNFCFKKIALVPGSHTYNHHLRLMFVEDINEEVLTYMQKAYDIGKNI
jgi:hypothetical protein